MNVLKRGITIAWRHIFHAFLIVLLVWLAHSLQYNTVVGLRLLRWLPENANPSIIYGSPIIRNLRNGNDRIRIATVELLESRNAWQHLREVIPFASSTNYMLAIAARRYIEKCEIFLRAYGWEEYSYGYDTPWGTIYTSNYLDNSAMDVAADAVVSNYIKAMLTTNWPEIRRFSQSGSVPDEPWEARDRKRFFLGSPSTFTAQRRVYTENELELEGLGSFPGLVTGLVSATFILLPEDNMWKISSLRFDIPDEIADEFFRDD